MSSLDKFIDIHIIKEHATPTRDGLSLDIADLQQYDQHNIVNYLFENDPATKEILLNRIQDLIEERLPFVESKLNYDKGLKPIHNSQTGEVRWSPNRGY